MTPFEAAIAILCELLPADFEFSAQGPRNSPDPASIAVYCEARRTSDLIKPVRMHFEIFVHNGKLIAQRLSDNWSIISRHEVPLADPACFEKTYDYFARACVL